MTSKVSTTLNVTTRLAPDRTMVSTATKAIIDYILEHPGARDTARGIAEWWIHDTIPVTQAAINLLHERGLLIQSQRNDQVLFSRNPSFDGSSIRELKASINSMS